MKRYGFFVLAGLLAFSLGIMAACHGRQQTEEESGYKVVGDTVEIGTADGLRLWADKVGWIDDFSGITLKLTADIDLSGEAWTPVDSEYRNLDGFVLTGRGIRSRACRRKRHRLLPRMRKRTTPPQTTSAFSAG